MCGPSLPAYSCPWPEPSLEMRGNSSGRAKRRRWWGSSRGAGDWPGGVELGHPVGFSPLSPTPTINQESPNAALWYGRCLLLRCHTPPLSVQFPVSSCFQFSPADKYNLPDSHSVQHSGSAHTHTQTHAPRPSLIPTEAKQQHRQTSCSAPWDVCTSTTHTLDCLTRLDRDTPANTVQYIHTCTHTQTTSPARLLPLLPCCSLAPPRRPRRSSRAGHRTTRQPWTLEDWNAWA